MKYNLYLLRVLSLVLGQLFTAVGVVMMLQANIGLEPWSVLQQGLNLTFGVSFGQATIIVSGTFILIDVILGEQIGVGTVFSVFIGGIFIDAVAATEWIPKQNALLPGVLFLLSGLEFLTLGSIFQMKAALGCGPRDALMVAFSKRTNAPAGVCRIALELVAVITGYLLGGKVGVGTVICAVGIGCMLEVNFRLLRFRATEVQHENLSDTLKVIRLAKTKQI